MKARKPSDPTSWFYQAAVHAVSPELLTDALERDPGVANVDQQKFWNRCPHFGASSAEFLVWHRGYLFYFERILRAASGDSTLSVPYWNYTDPAQRGFPRLFGNPEAPPEQPPVNPLFEAQREPLFMGGFYDLSAAVVSVGGGVDDNDFFGLDESSGFGGGVADGDLDTKGRLESRPHDLLHVAIGGPDDGLMSRPQTAAFDPAFWIHHSNIDRLWHLWECGPQRRWGSLPPTGWFDEHPWHFNDADGSVKNEPRRAYFDPSLFPAAYDTDGPDCKPLVHRLPLPAGQTVAGAAAPASAPKSAVAGLASGGLTIGPDAPARAQVSLQDGPLAAARRSGAAGVLPPGVTRRVMLELRGIEMHGTPTVGYDVYVDLPEGAAASRDSENYVGTIALFGLGHHGAAGARDTGQQFDITNIAQRRAGNPANLTVTIVPFDLFEPKPGQPRLRRPDALVIGRVRVSIVERGGTP